MTWLLSAGKVGPERFWPTKLRIGKVEVSGIHVQTIQSAKQWSVANVECN